MSIRVAFLAGTKNNQDTDFSKSLFENIRTAGVVEGLDISDGAIQPGVALIEATRTSGETLLVPVIISEEVAVDTTGTKKIYLEIDQSILDDGSSMESDHTGVVTVQTAGSYPDDNFLKIADVTGGSVTDEREFSRLKLDKSQAGQRKLFYSDGDGILQELALGTDGFVLQSNGPGAAPSFVELSSGFSWSEVTGTSQTAAVNNGYIANNANLVALTLPEEASVGDIVEVVGKGQGGFKVVTNSGQQIGYGKLKTFDTGIDVFELTLFEAVSLLCVETDNLRIVKNTTRKIIDLETGLRSCYRLLTDSTDFVGGYDGTDSNITYTTGGGGAIQEAASFNGSSSGISLPTGAIPTSSKRVLRAIAKQDTASGASRRQIFGHSNGQYNGGMLGISSDGKLGFSVRDNSNTEYSIGLTSRNSGQYYDLMAIIDDDIPNVDLYIDGVYHSSITTRNGTYSNQPSDDGAIGYRKDGNDYRRNGDICECLTYSDFVLTAEQVAGFLKRYFAFE